MVRTTPDSDEFNALEIDDLLLESIVIPDYVKSYMPTGSQLNTVCLSLCLV